ncbi:IS3 family transposase [Evansella sp. AB-P1]|uniref:IS3 family transposase n=1 Tax=Evansella sp. AB-P1 TaxID=3037653 RepID=UPI00241D4B07|nr:IS3 family transposase [Evansella sp. AB-P1]MDG5786003.1 IS3 family transposase [Evansella sp. AB-P1]
MCEVLEVSKSGYYKWLKKRKNNSPNKTRKEKIKAKIRRLFFQNKKVYGSPRITRELHKEGVKITERTVGRYMREMNLRAIPEQKFVVTTDSKHNNPVYPNLLGRKFNPGKPNMVWTTDITGLLPLCLQTSFSLFAGTVAPSPVPANLLFSICRFIGPFLCACKPSFFHLQVHWRISMCL